MPQLRTSIIHNNWGKGFSLDLGLAAFEDSSEMEEEIVDVNAAEEERECSEQGRVAESSDEATERRDSVTEHSDESTGPQRQRKAPTRLTYDSLGSPT